MEAVSWSHIGIFIGCLVVLLGLLLAMKWLFVRQPPIEAEFATKAELRSLEESLDVRLDTIDDAMASQERRLEESAVERVRMLNASINATRSGLDAKLEDVRKELDGKLEDVRKELDGKITGVPEAVLEVLSKTGHLAK
jgi:hypothetical protein